MERSALCSYNIMNHSIQLLINYEGDEYAGEAIPVHKNGPAQLPSYRVYLYGNDLGLIVKNDRSGWQGSQQMDLDLATAIGRAIEEQTGERA